ncbi:hypothetical protein Val02_28630 [Virgisporangium aliadipatigenens]|uniref:Oxygen sensor histidine kinase NreB n=1 Tax=Virgisporangium aliadipatigenens TaxID=741659 RepID=A0A8J3YKB1_9ACTN|nr:ATP-binding protein [Virgisporangium aliadipatigenens]GIJ45977.1 hypothetical protein Val02_28630 [Virgisporangium aliadipatigenens]
MSTQLRRDLHDVLGPALAALAFRLEAAQVIVQREPHRAAEVLLTLRSGVGHAERALRELVDGVRPSTSDSARGCPVARIRAFVDGLAGTPGPAITVHAPPGPAVPPTVGDALYLIVTEALTNVLRHAGAGRCAVRITRGEALEVEVRDDGVGMPDGVPRPGVGLRSMAARARALGGTCRVESVAGVGTRVRVRLPLPAR